MVFDHGRATILNYKEVSSDAIAGPHLRQSNKAGPQLAFLCPPASQEEFKEQMDLAFTGTDPIYQEKFYSAIDEHQESLLSQSTDIEKRMEESPQLAASVKQYLQNNNQTLESVAFFPIRGRNQNSIIILSRPEAEIIGHLDFSLESIGLGFYNARSRQAAHRKNHPASPDIHSSGGGCYLSLRVTPSYKSPRHL